MFGIWNKFKTRNEKSVSLIPTLAIQKYKSYENICYSDSKFVQSFYNFSLFKKIQDHLF